MAYRLTYSASIEWVAPGMGPFDNPGGPNQTGGNAQTLYFPNTQGQVSGVNYPPTSTTFLASDITALLASMTTDLSTQMNAAIARVQGFSSGGG